MTGRVSGDSPRVRTHPVVRRLNYVLHFTLSNLVVGSFMTFSVSNLDTRRKKTKDENFRHRTPSVKSGILVTLTLQKDEVRQERVPVLPPLFLLSSLETFNTS